MKQPRRAPRPEEELARLLLIARLAALGAGASVHEAEEVAQITACKFWEKWDAPHLKRARSRDRLRWDGYIRRAARNVHYDLVRGHQRRISRQELAAARSTIGVDYAGTDRTDAADSVDDIDRCLARSLIAAEIERLSPRQRQAATLYWLAEMTIREAAEVMGVQPQSVRKTLKAAEATLERRLSEPFNDE